MDNKNNIMKNIALKQVHYKGITMQIPEIWETETEEFDEADGTKSYSLSISASGNDVRSADISWGIMPEDTDAYAEACAAYEDVVLEEDLTADDEPIICFEFQGHEAYGFNVYTDDGLPCFFFCTCIPSKGKDHLLTVLVSAMNNEELQDLIEFTEEYLTVE